LVKVGGKYTDVAVVRAELPITRGIVPICPLAELYARLLKVDVTVAGRDASDVPVYMPFATPTGETEPAFTLYPMITCPAALQMVLSPSAIDPVSPFATEAPCPMAIAVVG
jgi:hypothetical protein